MFINRHQETSESVTQQQLKSIGCESLDRLIEQTVPISIRLKNKLDLENAKIYC